MNPDILRRLQNLCRDEEAFEQLKQILSDQVQSWEQEINQAYYRVEQQKALFRTISRLREPIDLERIFHATAMEVRQLLAVDRVGMFRFYANSGWDDGEFLSEDVDQAFASAMSQKIHDHCFGEQFASQIASHLGVAPSTPRHGLSWERSLPLMAFQSTLFETMVRALIWLTLISYLHRSIKLTQSYP